MRGTCIKRAIGLLLGLLVSAVALWTFSWRSGHTLTAPAVKPPLSPPLSAAQPPPIPRFYQGATSSPLRLFNTPISPGQLLANPRAILLENACFDSGLAIPLPDPPLQARGTPGAYIVQSRAPINQAFRTLLNRTGAEIMGYIPNQAYLVRTSEGAAQNLMASPLVQSVLPYQPYYKLKADLLKLAVEGAPLPAEAHLRVLLFPGPSAAARQELAELGMVVLAEEPSPFGPVLQLGTPPVGEARGRSLLADLARLPAVQELELLHRRLPANDLVRATVTVASDSLATTNYLGLTGANVLLAINDTGVDATHPDLAGRITGDSPNSLQDLSGHGTHVAGVIAGSGLESVTLTNTAGSDMPATRGQFRGMAPAARLFALSGGTDAYLQQAAAATNAFVSNNSWTYSAGGYDLAAASYDAATRDARPQVSGSQPVLFVFAAGNTGNGNDDGTGGEPDSVLSPGTAKNVITVGALEQARWVTNSVWGWVTNGAGHWQTNQPWLQLTSASNRVAGFSSRGNVGLGVEGNFGRFKPDVVAPGVFVVSARSQEWDQAGYYNPTNAALAFASPGNTLAVLSNLNAGLAAPPQRYRYETGTSMAAGCVAGTLALMQEFFQQRLSLTNSPALMKALLINGARPPRTSDDLCVTNPLNLHGWGMPNLPSTLPAGLTNLGSALAPAPILIFDQDASSALATGENQTRYVTLSSNAQGTPLRMTLVWTDPPGNPIAAIKLVNDLDLLVTNLDTGEIYWGNDIPLGSVTNAVWDPLTTPKADRVNNVESVCLAPPLGSHYSVTVVGRSVNMNAVASRTNAVVQDYALVIASGASQPTGGLTVLDSPIAEGAGPQLTVLTNQFDATNPDSGAFLLQQRVGASSPCPRTNAIALPAINGAVALGDTNQWHFYLISNDSGATNAAFMTFLARRLSPEALDSSLASGSNGLRAEADIDLYVSMESGLTNLDPDVVERADKSLSRGGTETIVYTNANPGVYYVGVKCESGSGAEYGFAAVLSQVPFSQVDSLGNETLRGFPAPGLLPPAEHGQPGIGRLLALATQPALLHRAIVTNTLTHEASADLVGTLRHLDGQTVLNRHTPGPAVMDQSFVYDDSAEADLVGTQPTDGPGSLNVFCGRATTGQWRLEEVNAISETSGTNNNLAIRLEPQTDLLGGLTAAILPGASRRDYITVPPAATNLSFAVSLWSGTGPLRVQACPVGASPGLSELCSVMTNSGGWLALDKTVTPPLNAGLYALTVSNAGPDAVTVSNWAGLLLNPNGARPQIYTSTGAISITDAAVTVARLPVGDDRKVVTAEAGVRITHPRVSDLVLHLVSPSGTRVLLSENRGGIAPDGMGQNIIVTNITPVSSSGGPSAYTNVLNTGQTSGTITINYDFYTVPDDMRVYYDDALIYDSGLVSLGGLTNIAFGPGADTEVTIVMNEGGNINPDDAWDYTVTATQPGFLYTTFTEDTNLTVTPIKFAVPPFTTNSPAPGGGVANGIFYLPEESLSRLTGESAVGEWTLEIEDTRAGPLGGSASLLGWQLALRLADSVPTPIPLVHHQPQTNTIASGQVQYFTVDVPIWARFATNSLLTASAPLTVVFNASEPPEVIPQADDFILFSHSTGGTAVLASNATGPGLIPGTRYYLALLNTNIAPVTGCFEVDFDVPVLRDGVPMELNLSADSQPAYFAYDVSTNATLVVFELQNLTADADLYANWGLPFPTPAGNPPYSSTNPGTNDEQILIFTNSVPPPAPGRWYLGAFNVDTTDLAGRVLADEFAVYGTNISLIFCQVSSQALCLNWLSSPGSYYHVMGATNLAGGTLVPLSHTLVANDFQTTFCAPLPSPFRTYLVLNGPAPGGDLTPTLIGLPVLTPAGIQLQWSAGTNSQFQIQWSPSLSAPTWTTLPGLLSSPTGTCSFLDDGSQTGGFDSARFYRLILIP